MATLEQHHSGDGDNIAGDKIINQIRSLAPKELIAPIEMVFDSLRQKDRAAARAQMKILRAIAQREEESAALVEVISIYGGLVDAQDRDAAWAVVARIVSRTINPIIRDVCQAALLQLSFGAAHESEAKGLYLADSSPGEYSKEAYLRHYADEEQLRAASKAFPSEGVLTGAVEGAFRLQLSDLALELASRLNLLYGSYNSRVLSTIAAGLALNRDLTGQHLWLTRPDVKERTDALCGLVIELLEEIGTDARVHDLGCSILNIYQGCQSGALFEALKRHAQHIDASRSNHTANFKVMAGDDSHLTQPEKDLQAAHQDSEKRREWCQQFLEAGAHTVEEVGPFIHLAKPAELENWLSRERLLTGSSEVDEAYIRLVALIFQRSAQGGQPVHRHEVSEQVEGFVSDWADVLPTLAPIGMFDLAARLLALNLPHRALQLTAPLIPSHNLWPSPYVLTHLQYLQAARQDKTFDELVARIKGADQCFTMLSFQSVQAERSGDIEEALSVSQSMIKLAPEQPYAWYRRCYLLNRYRSLEEQQAFHSSIPDSVLQAPSREVKGILFFLAVAGSFKRTESRWVEWMIKDPREHAIDLVNFHFGLGSRKSEPRDVSASTDQCLAGIRYAHEGNSLVRLIVGDEVADGEYTVKSSSQVGQLLLRLAVGDRENLNMASYKVEERLPPYVACLRIALILRHIHNDGSDCFVMMQIPSDPAEFIPFLEDKMSQVMGPRAGLQAMDSVPLFMRGHGSYPSDAFKAAMNCWTDRHVPKSPLCDIGEEEPASMVLDAYGIAYLAVTGLARSLLDRGVSFVLPAGTKEKLGHFLEEISGDDFMLMGLTDGGRLFRTTASDLRERDSHVLESLRLILVNAAIVQPVIHDAELEVFAIKDAVDSTVYNAMRLSLANKIPWFCMDMTFGALHNVRGHPLVNVQAVLLSALSASPFDFDERRHSLMLYAVGTLEVPVTYNDIYQLALTPNALAGFILLKIIQTRGPQIFTAEGRADVLLNAVYLHLYCMFGKDASAVTSKYSPGLLYTTHVFNHGLDLYLSLSDDATVEFRLATALHHMARLSIAWPPFLQSLVRRFVHFAHGRFFDWEAIRKHYLFIAKSE